MMKNLFLLLGIIFFWQPYKGFAQGIIYVKINAVGANTGESWTDAFTDLQDGLTKAEYGDTIWVARGIYKPTDCTTCDTTDRRVSFELKNGVSIYGGFEGDENTLSQRDLSNMEGLQAFVSDTINIDSLNKNLLVNRYSATILSGDIGVKDSVKDNSYRVLMAENISSTTQLEALAIMDGNANGRLWFEQRGGGAYMIKSSPSINYCIFISNQAESGGGMYNTESNPTLSNCTFVENRVELYGGGMFLNANSRPTFDYCIFTRNEARYGGGIRNTRSRPTLNHCTFVYNESWEAGGIDNSNSSPKLTHCTFSCNKTVRRGGGIFNSESRPILDNCTFIGNQAFSGGGVYNSESSITLNHCVFTNNSVRSNGGGILNYLSNPKLDSCSFEENRAEEGGGVYNSIAKPEFESCTFRKNEAEEGGGVYNYRESTPLFKYCYFFANKAEAGGGIYNYQSNTSLANSIFSGNEVDLFGGGIYNFITTLEVDSCVFTGNLAESGGGIYSTRSNLTLDSCIFTENRVDISGGAIYNFTSSLILVSSSFIGNLANEGGGIFNAESSPNLNHISFVRNRAKSGGGIYNSLSSPELKSCTFTINQADFGGGIYNIESSNPALDSCTFIGNKANNGGGIFSSTSSSTLHYCSFTGNQTQFGGGLYNTKSKLTLFHCTINENQADSAGGGIYSWQSTSNLLNCTLSKNFAKKIGGGIYNQSSNTHLTANTIAFNKADSTGGGIYSAAIDTTTFDNCLIANNEAFLGKDLFSNMALVQSLGHNLIRDTTYSRVIPKASDQLGNSLNPIDALLDTVLAYDGAYTKTIALLKGSPALGRGEPKNKTNILIDQRGFSRLIGSKSDSIDIGAYEQQHTFVISDSLKQVCIGDMNQVSLDEIVLADSTGGAWSVDTVKSLVLEFPKEIKIIQDSVKVIFEGPGLINTSYQIQNNQIWITYQKNYSTASHFIRLQGLKIQSLEPGVYSLIRSSVGNALQTNNDVGDSVIFASIIVLPIYDEYSLPYEESFETDKGGWQEAPQIERPIWEWGIPEGLYIQEAASGVSAWVTDLDNKFSPNVHHSIYSPCFDIQSLEKPIIALNMQSDTRKDLEGTVLQITTDQGKSWQTVGTDRTGKNWYNSTSLIANPGNQPINAQYGWSGRDSVWKKVVHQLDTYKEQSLIWFRITFRSTELEDPIENYEGFAFDDVFVGNRTRTVLLENFANILTDANPIERLLDTVDQDVIAINYHFYPQDELFRLNPAGPTSRALYYGRAKTNESILGGTDFQGLSSKLTARTVDTSALNPTKFEIFIDTTSNTPIAILANENIDDEIKVHVVIIEHNVITPSSVKIFNHVSRKFLPNSGGISFWGLNKGDTMFIPIDTLKWKATDFPKPGIVNDYANLEVVVFVQNQKTKEVYQATTVKIWQDLLDPYLVKREDGLRPQAKTFFYPNPAKRELFVIGEATELQIVDTRGRQIYQQTLLSSDVLNRINISALPKGVYQLILSNEDTFLLRKKIVIIP